MAPPKYWKGRFIYARGVGVSVRAAVCFALDTGHNVELQEAADWINS